MEESHEVLWRFFQTTGNIGAYLLYKELALDTSGGDELSKAEQFQ